MARLSPLARGVFVAVAAALLIAALLAPIARASPDAHGDDGGDEPPRVADNIAGERVGSKTDAETVEREEESIKIDGLSTAEVKQLRQSAKTYEFQAEVNRMMKLIINSLYKNKEIFLRELISNASDAIDKIRLISLTNQSVLDSKAELEIKIKADRDNNILHIIDSGIGMTMDDLQKNLGTIAKSGTADFLAKVQEGASDTSSLIGQFGVGFYSAFLVADRVVVTSKHNDDPVQHIWESDSSSFTIVADPRGNTLGRGTQVSLYLKPEAKEYLEQDKLEELVHKYSEFINHPIYLWASSTVQVEDEADADADAAKDEEADGETVVEADGSSAETAKDISKEKKKKEETVWDYKRMNSNRPIWTRNPKDVTDEEYNRFYTEFTKDTKEPIARIHFNAEGEIAFRAILYIPSESKSEHLNSIYKKLQNIKLYVRRVFITDDFEDLMPKYLNFIVGVVDSDDLPLNVSRETLQQHKLLKVIQKKLVRKALEMLKNLATDEEDRYNKIYKEFATHLKLGVIEDQPNRSRLAKLLRYHTSNSRDKQTSLTEYVERMKEKQDKVFYMCAASRSEAESSPFVERLLKKGYEVLYMTDPIDEYVMQNLADFEGKGFQNVAKEGLEFGDESAALKDLIKKREEEYQPLSAWLLDLLKEHVNKVSVSTRLADSPAALVAPQFGLSGNMERIIASQAMINRKDPMINFYKNQKRILEINPGHPLIKKLKSLVDDGQGDSDQAKDIALIIYDTAALRGNYVLSNPAVFAARLERMLRASVGISATEAVEELPEPTEVDSEEDAEEEEEDGEEGEDDAGEEESSEEDGKDEL
jgi:heat shock protein 90kDa beta